MSTWAVILAAGQGSRLAEAGLKDKKQFLQWRERPLFWHAARTFAGVPGIFGLVFVFPEAEFLAAQERVIDLDGSDGLNLPWLCVTGGARRQDSVACALAALPPDCTRVLIHDAARPFVSPPLCNTLLEALASGAVAAIPVLPLSDTVKRVTPAPDGGLLVAETLPRHELRAVQTPQAFALAPLREAHARAAAEDWEVTDDASLLERLGHAVLTVPGEADNVKITTVKDLELLQGEHDARPRTRPVTGWGYDVHRYANHPQAPKARPMKLGGIPIPGAPLVLAHSDGDVLLHALTDALLGCLGGGDIGDRFPDSDPILDNVPSCVLLDKVLQEGLARGLRLHHADLTLVAQVPRIAPHKVAIRENVARLLGLAVERVNVKATTEEGLGFTGEKLGLKAVAVLTGELPLA